MTRMPARRARADVALRLALVLVLLGLAAHGLSGRRGLDFDALSERPESPWVGLLLLGVAVFFVVVTLRTVLGLVRKAAADMDRDDGEREPGPRQPWWVNGVTMLVVIAVALLVYLWLSSGPPLSLRSPDPASTRDSGNPSPIPPNTDVVDSRALLLTVVVAAALGLAATMVLRRRRPAEDPDSGTEPDETDGMGEEGALAEAVAAAEEELDSHGDDTRAAIIAAYLAMERQLVSRGTARRASDTPTDFLTRAVATRRVSRGSAGRLTELFREARFSTHPMPPGAREDASRALARVAEDLTRAAP